MNAPTHLPADWRRLSLAEVARIERGKFSHRPRNEPRFYGGATPFVQTGDVTRSNGTIRAYTQTLNAEGVAISKVFPAGTILITIAANIGYAGVLAFDSAAPDSLVGLTPNGLIDVEFLSFYLQTQQPEMDRVAPKGTQKNINIQFLRRWPIVVPPIAEQRNIARVLLTVRRAIEAQERIIQTTTELKKALMHKLFTEGLRNEAEKQTEIGPVPESWEVNRFDSFAVLQRGFDITKKDQRPGEYPVVSSGGISSFHDKPKVKGPGVVIGRKGSLGTVHYIPTDYWPHDTTLWVKDFKGNNPQFIAYLLETMRLERFDTGAANPTLNRNIVHGEKIAVPSIDQQVEIGGTMKAVESKIITHQNRNRWLQNLFRTLLHELMTSNTRVHNVRFNLISTNFLG